MWFSVAWAGMQILGNARFRAPDGIADVVVAPNGSTWVISEHGQITGFDKNGAILNNFDACPDRSNHTELEIAPDGARLGIDCGLMYRVFDVPKGSLGFEVPMQTAKAHFTTTELVIIGEEFIDGVTADTTAIHRFDAAGTRTGHEQGDYVDAIDASGLVALEYRTDDEGAFVGWGLTRFNGTRTPSSAVHSGDADTPPTLTARGKIVCASTRNRGWCENADGTPNRWTPNDRAFLAPEQGIPICNVDRSTCYDVDRTRMVPQGEPLGIGRIEDLSVSSDGKHMLTRDHRDQVLYHGPKGRRPITTTDGAIALSPSGRYAWYQTARRSMRVELLTGVRTTFPRATAALFDNDDVLWMALPGREGAFTIAQAPPMFVAPIPAVPVHIKKEITGLQLVELGDPKPEKHLLLEYAQDDQYAVIDLHARQFVDGERGSPSAQSRSLKPHVYSPRTPIALAFRGAVLRAIEQPDGLSVRMPALDRSWQDARWVRLSKRGPIAVVDNEVRDARNERIATLPGPPHQMWIYNGRSYIALRDGRLAIVE